MSAVVFLIAVLIAFSLAARLCVRRLRARPGPRRVDVLRTLLRRSESLVIVEILPTPLSRPPDPAPPTRRTDEHFVEAVWSDVARQWASSWASGPRTPVGARGPRRP